eukprot:EG_transcript_8083
MAQFGTATQTGVVTVHVYEVQDVPLDTMAEVVLHWKYGQLEGYSRPAMVGTKGAARFDQKFEFPHYPVRRAGKAPRNPGPLVLQLLHLHPCTLPREVDTLRISVEALDGLHGRLRVVSRKQLVFDLRLTSAVDAAQLEVAPTAPPAQRSTPASKGKAAVQAVRGRLKVTEMEIALERHHTAAMLQEIRQYQALVLEEASGSDTSGRRGSSEDPFASEGPPRRRGSNVQVCAPCCVM